MVCRQSAAAQPRFHHRLLAGEPERGADHAQQHHHELATAAASRKFAACVSKRLYGYALYRVFGSYGRPCMTWELHFEEITGFANGSGMEFKELCREYSQVPSYSLVRNTYRWFLRAESVSYLLGQSADSSATSWTGTRPILRHLTRGRRRAVALPGRAGEFRSYADDPSLTERAYPCVCDLDGDGVTDLLCGAADGLFHFYRGTGLPTARPF